MEVLSGYFSLLPTEIKKNEIRSRLDPAALNRLQYIFFRKRLKMPNDSRSQDEIAKSVNLAWFYLSYNQYALSCAFYRVLELAIEEERTDFLQYAYYWRWFDVSKLMSAIRKHRTQKIVDFFMKWSLLKVDGDQLLPVIETHLQAFSRQPWLLYDHTLDKNIPKIDWY